MTLTDSQLREIQLKAKLTDQIIQSENILIKDFPVIPWTPYYKTNNFIQGTFSRMFGFSTEESKWIRMLVNKEGGLLFSGEFLTSEPLAFTKSQFGTLRIDTVRRLLINLAARDSAEFTLFDGVVIANNETATHAGINVSDFLSKIFLLSADGAVTCRVQVSNDNVNFYDYYNTAQSLITFTGANEKRAFPFNDYMKYMRILITNTSGADRNVTGVLLCQV